jgi:hypothetical protein
MPPKKKATVTSVIVFNRPSKSPVCNKIIKILCHLTGVTWGYVGKKTIQYISSNEIPIKVGTSTQNYYERFRKYKLDIDIINRSSAEFSNVQEWEIAVTAELQYGLLKIPNLSPSLREKIAIWQPSGEFAELLQTADEFLARYGDFVVKERDAWMLDCEKIV